MSKPQTPLKLEDFGLSSHQKDVLLHGARVLYSGEKQPAPPKLPSAPKAPKIPVPKLPSIKSKKTHKSVKHALKSNPNPYESINRKSAATADPGNEAQAPQAPEIPTE